MRKRRFPTDAEVDRWIADHLADLDVIVAAYGPAKADQIQAASRDTMALSRRLAPLFSAGRIEFESDAPGPGTRMAVRMYLAAESYGIRPACPHVETDRPLTLMCDPPTVSCTTCLPLILPGLMFRGFRFNHVCDHCGRQVKTLAAVAATLGCMMIHGHVCRPCKSAFLGAVAPHSRPAE